MSAFLSVLTGAMTILAMVPLFSVLILLVVNAAGKRASQRQPVYGATAGAAGMDGGGIGNAILGTLLMVGIASLISVPVGILAAVYMAEFGPTTKTTAAVRFVAQVLTGLPSILAGVFAYAPPW